MCWSLCGKYLASGAVAGTVPMDHHWEQKCLQERITSLEWDPLRGHSIELGEQLLFADLEGYVGAFDDVYPPETALTNQVTDETVGSSSPIVNDDPLVDDSLLMEVSKSL